ncbi:MAG TPA: condensation domain-containing protein [Candidatus Sulfotelmatobacter sp.]|nr:condensation domain-containing protein [Candidatus Sulfotelmatobacter sp.]
MEPVASIGQLSETKRRLLDSLLSREKPARQAGSGPISRRNHSGLIPLSIAQEEIWRRDLDVVSKFPFFNESITIHRQGPLDEGALQRSLTEIVRRHEVWRTTFEILDGQPSQMVRPAPEAFPISTYDLSTVPESRKEDEALRLASEQAREGFNLKTGPLLRVSLVHLDDTRHRVHATMHQIIVDGVSVFRVFPFELIKLYEAFAKGRPSPLPEPNIQYGDFASWQKEFLGREILEQQLNYWRKRLSGQLPALQWPRDRPGLAMQTYRGSIVPGEWPRDLAEKLRIVCRDESVSLFMVLLAGFILLLHYYTKQNDIIVGTLAPAGRERQEVQELLGCFLNPVPLRFSIERTMTFHHLLQQAREVVSGAVANDDVPFYRIEERVSGSSSREKPLFDAVISLAPRVPDFGPGWDQTFMDVESGGARWNLYLELNERPQGLIFRTQYNPDLFDVETIRLMTDDLKLLLEAAAAEPRKTISELLRK